MMAYIFWGIVGIFISMTFFRYVDLLKRVVEELEKANQRLESIDKQLQMEEIRPRSIVR